MKNLLKGISLLVLLVAIFLVTTKDSFNKPAEGITKDGVSYAYSITAYATNGCYSGTCTAVRTSDYATFNMAYDAWAGGYFTYASGLGPGTYNITICCGGHQGVGQVTIPEGATGYPWVYINLSGLCGTGE